MNADLYSNCQPGPEVSNLQQQLNILMPQLGITDRGQSQITVDGIFGLRTYEAVVAFQRKTPGLVPNGIVDPLTRAAIQAALPVNTILTPLREISYQRGGLFQNKLNSLCPTDEGIDVAELQFQLLTIYPPENTSNWLYTVTGGYGDRTEETVRQFQRDNIGTLLETGIADPDTRNLLAQKSPQMFVKDWNVKHIKQVNANGCWAACIAMMLNSTERTIIDQVKSIDRSMVGIEEAIIKSYLPAEKRGFIEGLIDRWDHEVGKSNLFVKTDSDMNYERLAQIFGLKFQTGMSWTPKDFVNAFKKGPIAIEIKTDRKKYLKLENTFGHFLLFSGMVSDYDNSGNRTYLKMHDPLEDKGRWLSFEEYHKNVEIQIPTSVAFTFP